MRRSLCLLIAAGLSLPATSIARADPEFDLFIVRAFNANPLAGETFITGINESGVACGNATMDNRIGPPGFVWTESRGKTEVPVASPQSVSTNGLVVGIGGAYDTATATLQTPLALPMTYGPPFLADVNQSGLAVGSISTCSCSDSQGVLRTPYIWDSTSGARGLPFPTQGALGLTRVNNLGVAIGPLAALQGGGSFSVDTNSGWTTRMIDVFPAEIGAGPVFATDINDSGEIVGYRAGTQPVGRYAYIYSASNGVTILPFPGTDYQQAVTPTAMNNNGAIVGWINTLLASQRAFLCSANRGIRDLNDPGLVSGIPSGFRLVYATAVSDSGWIAGPGNLNGQNTGFVLKPRPRACLGDFNADGSVDSDDTIAFFAAWDASLASADLDGSAGVDGDDIIVFFAAWDSGC